MKDLINLRIDSWNFQEPEGTIVPNTKGERIYSSYEFCLTPFSEEDYENLNAENKALIGIDIYQFCDKFNNGVMPFDLDEGSDPVTFTVNGQEITVYVMYTYSDI